jgi:TolB-like protein/Tfp pilus assembly protein PilF
MIHKRIPSLCAAAILALRGHPDLRKAILPPFANLSGDLSQEYFADGMTDELITMLAKNTSMRVVSRTSAMRYKGVQRPVPDIARELGVEGIVEGSVERSGNRVHMTVQMIHAPSDTHIWAESYDRDLNGSLLLPSEVPQTIAKEVNAAVLPVRPQRYLNPEAHDAYLRGLYFWFRNNNDDARSQEYFEKPIQLQPDYSAAWSGLANAYIVQAVAMEVPARQVMGKAEVAAHRAAELDSSLAEAHNSLAALYFFGDWDLTRADAESVRAISLNPNYAEAHHLRAYILEALNRRDDALREQKRCTELDQFERPWALGKVLMQLRQFDAAVNELRLRAEAPPQDSGIRFLLADAYRFKGMEQESFRRRSEVFAPGRQEIGGGLRACV